MNISFGQKIPIARAQIYSKEQKSFVPVTCYEYDCEDKSDIKDIENSGDGWIYKLETLINMRRKREHINNGAYSDVVVFTLEKDDGETVGLCCAEDRDRSMEVKYIESKQDNKHKYIGQAFLASIATKMINNSRQNNFFIRNGIESAHSFYEEVCGFTKAYAYGDFIMNREKTRKFIKQTEKRINSPIIELTA